MPSYQGKGIVPLALKTLITEVFIPFFNLHRIKGSYFEHNGNSRKVMLKCGFEDVEKIPEAVTINPAKIGGIKGRKVGLGVTRWDRDEAE
jgi:RimJ/RimL family protein N-acetyltransferase